MVWKGAKMKIKEAAARLGITERMLRHYEKAGLLRTRRSANGYRNYTEADLRRAGRIRDIIATGFSTREALSMAGCLSDEGARECDGSIPQLLEKLEQIDRLKADLETRREAVLNHLARFREARSNHHDTNAASQVAAEFAKPYQRFNGREQLPRETAAKTKSPSPSRTRG